MEVQCRIEQDGVANAYSRCFSALVAARLDRLLDTGTGELLQKKGHQGYERIKIVVSSLFHRFQEVEAANTSLKEILLGL